MPEAGNTGDRLGLTYFPIRDTIPSRNPPIALAVILANASFFSSSYMPAAGAGSVSICSELCRTIYHPECLLGGLPIRDYGPSDQQFLHGSCAPHWQYVDALDLGDNVEDRMGRLLRISNCLRLAAGIVHC